MKRTKQQIWWSKLSPAEKARRIANYERRRASQRKQGKNETWTNAAGTFHKVWRSPDSYSITRVPHPNLSDIIQ